MKKLVAGFIHAKHKESWDNESEEYKFSWHSLKDMSICNYIYVMPHELEIDIPDDFNPIPDEIENYRKEQTRIRAEAEQKINMLEDQIGKLSCLEYKP